MRDLDSIDSQSRDLTLTPMILIILFVPIAAAMCCTCVKGCCEWIGLHMERNKLRNAYTDSADDDNGVIVEAPEVKLQLSSASDDIEIDIKINR